MGVDQTDAYNPLLKIRKFFKRFKTALCGLILTPKKDFKENSRLPKIKMYRVSPAILDIIMFIKVFLDSPRDLHEERKNLVV